MCVEDNLLNYRGFVRNEMIDDVRVPRSGLRENVLFDTPIAGLETSLKSSNPTHCDLTNMKDKAIVYYEECIKQNIVKYVLAGQYVYQA